MKELQALQKGSIALVDGWWFVIVAIQGEDIYCICDNANNRYSHKISEAKYIASPYEAMRASGWGEGKDEFLELIRERSIPVDIIAEVLAGCQDDRFDDWLENNPAGHVKEK